MKNAAINSTNTMTPKLSKPVNELNKSLYITNLQIKVHKIYKVNFIGINKWLLDLYQAELNQLSRGALL